MRLKIYAFQRVQIFMCYRFNDRQKIGMFTHAPAFKILNYLLFEESPMCREPEETKLKSIQIKIIRKNALFPKKYVLETECE